MDASAAKAMKKLVAEAKVRHVHILWTHTKPSILEDLRVRQILTHESDWFQDLDEVLRYVNKGIVEYWMPLQSKWLELHPSFVHHQAFLRTSTEFEPFQDIFIMEATRVGCPWKYCNRLSIKRYETILWESGTRNGTLYLVHTGAVALFKDLPVGKELLGAPVAVYTKGWFLNHESLVQAPSEDYAVAIEDGELLYWNEKQWFAIEDGELLYWNEKQWFAMAREHPMMASQIMRAVLKQSARDMRYRAKSVDAPHETHTPNFIRGLTGDLSTQSLPSATSADDSLPEVLLEQMQKLRVAAALEGLGFYQAVPAGPGSLLPKLPPGMYTDLWTAFQTYSTGPAENPSIPLDKLQDALMFIGVFHTFIDKAKWPKPSLDWNEFVHFGQEAIMARLSEEQVSTIKSIFHRYDEDNSGELDVGELADVFQGCVGDQVSIERVDSIAAAWSADGGQGAVDEEDFIAILSRFIRMHEHHWTLLHGFKEVLGVEEIDTGSRLSIDDLMKSKRVKLTRDQAMELLWSVDWHCGHPDGDVNTTSVNFGAFVAAVHIIADKVQGKLPQLSLFEDGFRTLESMERQQSPFCDMNIAVDRRSLTARNIDIESITSVAVRNVQLEFAHIIGISAKQSNGHHDKENGGWFTILSETSESLGTLSVRAKLNLFLEDPYSSRIARAWAYVVAAMVLFSVLILLVSGSRSEQSASERQLWFTGEFVLTFVFTLELIARIWSSEDRLLFLQDPQTVIDVIAVLPAYLQAALWKDGEDAHIVIRALKLSWMARLGRLSHMTSLAAPVAVVLVLIWGIFVKHQL
eukprot:gnl/TRDRNA2_/TRDRNA2_147658_c0_seq1.p1 gnl/TRDRNA2_/TRDRNA2_147658_c0~~gnl/TRDRNA2_/TRDRNA2_147658_c0_seq1.p1  ORF type:complete len:848 (-),score=117.65 gnl/TRDRNA2_/TRDRNA2_147658_c0_seq1:106-2517(-)